MLDTTRYLATPEHKRKNDRLIDRDVGKGCPVGRQRV
jgi:hypothetical protein